MKGSKYSDEQREKAIALIASGKSQTQAAKALGIPKSTVSHWYNTRMLDDEDVVAARAEARRASIARCGRIVDKAIGAIGRRISDAAKETKQMNDGLKVLSRAARDGVLGLNEDDIKLLRRAVQDYTSVGLRELSGSMKDVAGLQAQLEAQLQDGGAAGQVQITFSDNGDLAG